MAVDPVWLLLALAFAPAVVYLAGLAWRHRGPSLGAALLGFGYGATLSLLVLAFVYAALGLLVGNPVERFQGFFAERAIAEAAQRDFVVIVVLAPLTEELAKGAGVALLGGRLRKAADGAFLGAAVGLGFAAVETFLYLLAAWVDGGSELAGATLVGVVVLAGVRSVSAAFVHPAATGLTGYGIARARLRGKFLLVAALPYYLLAVLLHAAYNYLAGFLPPQDVGGFTLELNLLAALALAFLAWGALKRGVAGRA